MVAVSVGVPVYNGADRLRASLQCLRDQTFTDFEVLIFDNDSTDETGNIAQEFAEKDSRFRYVRQSENVGPYINFIDALDAAQGKYFFWRAHDDLSALNFIEVLYKLLEDNPHAYLAASRVFNTNSDGSETFTFPVPDTNAPTRLGRIRKMLFNAQSCWFYAFWRRDAITKIIHETHEVYPFTWASDPLMLFTPIIDEAIVTTNETTFTQLTRDRPARVRASTSVMIPARRAYLARCKSEAALRDFSFIERLQMHFLIRQHTSDRCYGLRKISRRLLHEMVRGRPANPEA
tara:strand:- start:10449 stop:11318 length:870 start_codon:yes stop_codon:yes gene_type:complete